MEASVGGQETSAKIKIKEKERTARSSEERPSSPITLGYFFKAVLPKKSRRDEIF
jgi:hypothetical protein